MTRPPTLLPPPARTLDRYGAASRCLLRLWENEGNLSPSDQAFLRRFESQFPGWQSHPGELEGDALGIVARELGLADRVTTTRDYEAVLLAHRFGHAIIVVTAQAPLQQAQASAPHPHSAVLEQIDEDGFVLWCPFESGASDLLPRAERKWWDRWESMAIVLHADTAGKGD